MRKLLEATSNFDDAVTNLGILIYDTLEPLGLDVERTFYFYQDFSSSTTLDLSKERIGQITLKKRDFVNAEFDASDSKSKIVHFIRSRIYKKLADTQTLKYFNKIIFKT